MPYDSAGAADSSLDDGYLRARRMNADDLTNAVMHDYIQHLSSRAGAGMG